MLLIVATLKEFWSMVLGADIHVFTDHKNLMFDTLKTQHVLYWRTKIEKFSPKKIWRLILSKRNPCYAGAQKLKSFHPYYTTSRVPAPF